MSRIFLSHSSANNAEAVALRDWLEREGWKDEIFLDLDPNRGIAAGERWERALHEAANRCEAVLFLVSKAWLGSGWCLKEFHLANGLNKQLFGVLIEDLPLDKLPEELAGTWQIVQLAAGRDHVMLRAVLPVTHEEAHVAFSAEGLQRLKHGLEEAGLDPEYFAWPPPSDANRPPYRGLRPLEAEDAGIFFGRDAPIVEALDELRGLRATTPPRLLVILGASGAGKSSFLRAGLFPRLKRDDRNFLPLPVIRPERAAINGETGLLSALEAAFAAGGIRDRARRPARGDPGRRHQAQAAAASARREGDADGREWRRQSQAADPGPLDRPGGGVVPRRGAGRSAAVSRLAAWAAHRRRARHHRCFSRSARTTTRRLQLAPELEGVRQDTLSLPPMPRGSYAEVIKGPAQRLQGTARALKIDDGLIAALLTDIDAGGAKDALPLLAFTLERLYGEYHSGGSLKLAHYNALGRVKGSIAAAVERALQAADADPAIPRDRAARLALLRRGLIPWLAGIDPDTGAPRRRVARLSEIPAEARPLIQHLVEQRLLATDVNKDTGEATVEPAHEALLRQWGLLDGWLTEDAALLAVLEGVKRASRDWAANNRARAWLAHATDRLAAAERLSARPNLAANLEPTDREYIAACRMAEADARRGKRLLLGGMYVLLVAIILGLVGWIKQAYIWEQWRWWTVTRPIAVSQVRPHVLTAAQEQALRPGNSFKECAQDCPQMIVVPAGSFTMGAPATESHAPGYATEIPQQPVTFSKPFAVSKYELTFADWDACVSAGGCNGYKPTDQGWGREQRPAINVSWEDAQQYVAWLSEVTGKTYRLLSESEYEYAARAGTTTAYPWADYIGKNNANCDGCGSKWDSTQTAPVGSFAPNQFGLFDMVGNVWEWTEDCGHKNYNGAPADGSAWITGGDCSNHVVRGGSWISPPDELRSARRRGFTADFRLVGLGFRVARTLSAITVAPGAR